jgi:hypothetical protein
MGTADMEMHQQLHQKQTLSQRVVYLFRDSDTEFTRFVSALAMFGWCLILLQPGSTFGTSKAFDGLDYLFRWSPMGSEPTWGVIAGILAAMITLSAVFDVERWHAASLFLATVWWLYILVSMYMSSPLSTGVAGYGAIFVGALWAFLRFMARHDVVERR